MKKITVLFVLLINIAIYTYAQDVAENLKNSSPTYKWITDTIITVGKIEANKPASIIFEFTNTGNTPLVISKVESSCGCTQVEFSKNPVNKNEKGYVKTIYNAGSQGFFHKTLTVFSNTPEYKTVLTIKGEVVN